MTDVPQRVVDAAKRWLTLFTFKEKDEDFLNSDVYTVMKWIGDNTPDPRIELVAKKTAEYWHHNWDRVPHECRESHLKLARDLIKAIDTMEKP